MNWIINIFAPEKKSQRNYIDVLFDFEIKNSKKNKTNNNNSSVFVAPLDYLIQNVLIHIEAHIPDYDKHFKSVKEEIEL